MPTFVSTRIHWPYDTWRELFDRDVPRAREKAPAQRAFRRVDNPNHVFVWLESASRDGACPRQRA